VNWILDADISRFFETVDHEWLIRFVEQRIGDQRAILQPRPAGQGPAGRR